MEKLVFINACIRQGDSRTLGVAKPLLAQLGKRYAITQIDLTQRNILPINAEIFHTRGTVGISEEDAAWAKAVAEADRIVVAAPFWDMSFPSVLKAFFEHISVPGITFENNPDGTTRGNCRASKLLYVTTRGMEIPTESALDQGTPYLKALCWLWGIPEVYTVAAWGMDVKESSQVQKALEEAVLRGLQLCEDF